MFKSSNCFLNFSKCKSQRYHTIGQKTRLKKKLNRFKKRQNCIKNLHNQKNSFHIEYNEIDNFDFSKYNCSKIFIEIVKLTLKYGTNEHTPRYSDELKIFAYSIYCISPSAYRSFKKQFRLPSERCLRKIKSQELDSR